MMREGSEKRRVRSAALLWMAVALVFYFSYILVSVYRARH
jgi:hypothetical protein